jgi:ATP-dependent RNA helicase RhlB
MAGKAISLASEEDVYFLESIEEFIGQKIPVIWAEDDWFIADKSREMTPVQARIARMPKAASGRRRSRPPAKEGQPSGPRKRNTGPKAGATGQKPKDSRRFRQH